MALTADLKLGHYMHVPPVALVTCQLIGTCIGVLFNTGGAFVLLDLVKCIPLLT
jgi:OPT oligopeptide transporter protein